MDPKKPFPLSAMRDYPVWLAVWHWGHRVSTPISGDQ